MLNVDGCINGETSPTLFKRTYVGGKKECGNITSELLRHKQNVRRCGEHPAEKVTVQLREKAAVLAGRVYDAATGLPLKANVGFINLRTETGEFGIGLAGHTVSADGKFS